MRLPKYQKIYSKVTTSFRRIVQVVKKGGVGIFYKESLPLRLRQDLAFDECIVAELNFGREKIFFTVLYRNPIQKSDSPEFLNFIRNIEDLHRNITNEKTYALFFTGGFNAKSLSWWSEGVTTDDLFSKLNLTQIISEPTHFHENCLPSCIDLIVTDQPNLVLDSGVRPSLDPMCKHQISFCKINFSIPSPPTYTRNIWQYNKANTLLITRAMSQFPWMERLNELDDNPTLQVDLLNKTILNIISSIVPNKTIRIKPSKPAWLTKEIKNILRKQNRKYKKYKNNGFREVDIIIFE